MASATIDVSYGLACVITDIIAVETLRHVPVCCPSPMFFVLGCATQPGDFCCPQNDPGLPSVTCRVGKVLACPLGAWSDAKSYGPKARALKLLWIQDPPCVYDIAGSHPLQEVFRLQPPVLVPVCQYYAAVRAFQAPGLRRCSMRSSLRRAA